MKPLRICLLALLAALVGCASGPDAAALARDRTALTDVQSIPLQAPFAQVTALLDRDQIPYSVDASHTLTGLVKNTRARVPTDLQFTFTFDAQLRLVHKDFSEVHPGS